MVLDFAKEGSPNITNADEEPKVIIIDNNPRSIAGYAQEYPEKWIRICEALDNEESLSDKRTGAQMGIFCYPEENVKGFIKDVAVIMMISDKRERLRKLKERAGPKLI